MKNYDFCGYATRNDLRCADGRIIRHNAFLENDGQTVPLVYQHVHTDPTNVIGHALLENRDDGVYAYGTFNKTPSGLHAKEMVRNGDIVAMSIFANRLVQNGSDVIHGAIREVSLVLTGANPGAYIENVSFAHADGSYTESDTEAIIYSGEDSFDYISHAESDTEEDNVDESNDILDELTDEQIDAIQEIVDAAIEDRLDDVEDNDVLDDLDEDQLNAVQDLIQDAVSDALEHADYDEDVYYDDDYDDDVYYDYDDYYMRHADDDEDYDEDDDTTIGDIIDSMNEDQKNALYYLVSQAGENSDVEHSGLYEGDYDMKHNVFDDSYDDYYENDDVLTHDEFSAIMDEAQNSNSLKDVFLAHGIEDLEVLYPEAHLTTPTPEMISRDMTWVDVLWNALKRTPFGRIKSTAANITGDEARAKGYVKGNMKTEEVVTLLSRETTPQTVYKKQKMDRDDIIDITTIDVIAWLKQEMRIMLNEELCRAFLIGDGRKLTDPDKIKEDKIRPIYTDSDLYTIHYELKYENNDDVNVRASKLADAAVRARKDYKGTGTPIMFASNEVIADLLLAKDNIGRRLYKDEEELKSAMRVSRIVETNILENVTRTVGTGASAKTFALKALIFNPGDYTVGSDRGGSVTLFDDFDIDYNQQKYLIETRCCGALTKPYSAIAIEVEQTLSELTVAPMASNADLWGTTVSDVQTNVSVDGDKISGTLKYVDTGALASNWGSGNFVALSLANNDFTGLTSVKIGLRPSAGAGLQEIINDEDKAGVFKVTDKFNQKFVIVQTDGKQTVTQTFGLSKLNVLKS